MREAGTAPGKTQAVRTNAYDLEIGGGPVESIMHSNIGETEGGWGSLAMTDGKHVQLCITNALYKAHQEHIGMVVVPLLAKGSGAATQSMVVSAIVSACSSFFDDLRDSTVRDVVALTEGDDVSLQLYKDCVKAKWGALFV
jgi:O-acetyl-ADP-ribose deacetylase (regulator of RNase III)